MFEAITSSNDLTVILQVEGREGGDSAESGANAGSSRCTCTDQFAIKSRIAARVSLSTLSSSLFSFFCANFRNLFHAYRETSALWVSIDVPVAQPPGVYTGEISITAVRAVTEYASRPLHQYA